MSSCAWYYELLPIETNVSQDFAALWVQMEIDPGKACVHEIGFEVKAPKEVRLVSAAPAESHVTDPSIGTARLVVDGDGAAPVPGVIEQDVALAPGFVSAELGEHHYRFLWTGNTRRRVMVAIGVQLADDTIPKSLIQTWSESLRYQWGDCRAWRFDRTRDPRRDR